VRRLGFFCSYGGGKGGKKGKKQPQALRLPKRKGRTRNTFPFEVRNGSGITRKKDLGRVKIRSGRPILEGDENCHQRGDVQISSI